MTFYSLIWQLHGARLAGKPAPMGGLRAAASQAA